MALAMKGKTEQLNVGKSTGDGVSTTYEAHSGACSSVWSGQERSAFLQLFPRGKRVGTLHQNRKQVQTLPSH